MYLNLLFSFNLVKINDVRVTINDSFAALLVVKTMDPLLSRPTKYLPRWGDGLPKDLKIALHNWGSAYVSTIWIISRLLFLPRIMFIDSKILKMWCATEALCSLDVGRAWINNQYHLYFRWRKSRLKSAWSDAILCILHFNNNIAVWHGI